MKNKSLVDIAREETNKNRASGRYPYDKETEQLAVAWARGEVSLKGVARALGEVRTGSVMRNGKQYVIPGSNTYSYLAKALRNYIIRKKI